MSGLGGRPIKVSLAVNRIKGGMNRCDHEGRHVPNQVLNDVMGASSVSKSSDQNSWESLGNGQPTYDPATYWQQYQHFQQQLQQQHQQLQQQYQQFQQIYQQWQQWQQQHPPPNAAAGQGAEAWRQKSYDASQEELPAPEVRKAEVVKVKREKDHAAAISAKSFAKSFVIDENFNMEAVIGGHVEVKSEGDIDDTIKVSSKLNSLEKKKAENTVKKHKDKNKFDLKELKQNQKEKERRKRKKEAEDIAERLKFQKGVVNFAQEDKEEESTGKPKPK